MKSYCQKDYIMSMLGSSKAKDCEMMTCLPWTWISNDSSPTNYFESSYMLAICRNNPT